MGVLKVIGTAATCIVAGMFAVGAFLAYELGKYGDEIKPYGRSKGADDNSE